MKNHRWLKFLIVAALVAIVGVVVLVNRLDRGGDEVSFEYRLKWLANAGFVGDLYADTYGYYLAKGLKVQVAQGGPDRDALTALLRPNSSTWFAVASADQVIHAIYRGGQGVKVIAQIYAVNPVRWIYRANIGPITKPSDLRGKRIGVALGDNDDTMMRAYLAKNGMTERDVTFVGIQFDYGPFTSGAVDLYPVYSNTQAVELKAQMEASRQQVGFFDPSAGDYGVHFAANSVVTTSRIAADHPDIVKSFLEATLRGWEDSIQGNNRERAAHAVELAAGEGAPSANMIEQEIAATALLVKPKEDYQIGQIDCGAWRETEDTMYARGLLDNGGVRPPKIGIEAFLTGCGR